MVEMFWDGICLLNRLNRDIVRWIEVIWYFGYWSEIYVLFGFG